MDISSKDTRFEYRSPFVNIDGESIERIQSQYLSTGVFSIGKQHPSKSLSFIQFNESKGKLLFQHQKIRAELCFDEWNVTSMMAKIERGLDSTTLQIDELLQFLGIDLRYLIDSILKYKSKKSEACKA